MINTRVQDIYLIKVNLSQRNYRNEKFKTIHCIIYTNHNQYTTCQLSGPATQSVPGPSTLSVPGLSTLSVPVPSTQTVPGPIQSIQTELIHCTLTLAVLQAVISRGTVQQVMGKHDIRTFAYNTTEV